VHLSKLCKVLARGQRFAGSYRRPQRPNSSQRSQLFQTDHESKLSLSPESGAGSRATWNRFSGLRGNTVRTLRTIPAHANA
jgi:hypothetical protein